MKAEEQATLDRVKIEDMITYTNEFLTMLGIETIEENKVLLCGKDIRECNRAMKATYDLKYPNDVVWMKFTKDGYLGVVAVSNDINFTMPSSIEDYQKKKSTRYRSWVYNTSGIILHHVNKEWNEEFVCVFPLKNLSDKNRKRGDIERGIGNYLIEKGVPILDYYSHNY